MNGGMNVVIDRDPRAERAITRWDELKADRAHHEADWEDMARLIRPQRGGFSAADPGRPRTDKPLSSAPIVAASNFSSGLYGALINPANKWLSVKASDPDLAAWRPMALWQETVGNRILASFRPSVSPFYSAGVQIFGDLAVFGNGAQYDEERRGEGRILDITISLAEVCYDIDAFGRVVEVVRKFKLNAEQAADLFGLDALPEKLREKATAGNREKVDFYQHVVKNRDWMPRQAGPRGKRWISVYATETARAVVRERGYDEMPFHTPRWEVDSGQTYARGAAYSALPAAREINLMKAANLRAGQKAADPTLLAPDRDAMQLNGVVRPGEVVYGGVDIRGRQMVHTLNNFSGTGLTLDMQERAIEDIRDAFHWSLMNLAGRTGMTATEVMERQEEKLRLMAPHMGRIQEEYLAPKIARRFFLLWRAGQLPPPPQGLPAGVSLDVQYLSAAAMAQKSAEGAAVVRLAADIAPLAGAKPRLLDRISDDDFIEVLAEARGAPGRVLASREDADAAAQARQQQQQAAQVMQAAQVGGGVVKDLATAQAAGRA